MPRYLIVILAVACASPARAIITMGGDGRLPSPPPGAYRDSGVQYTGNWGSFVGTAIGPHHFLTAAHVGGGVGNVFTLAGKKHVAESVTVVEGTDLAVWRVRERFERWAPLSETRNDAGKEIVLYGRGCKRGRPLLSDGVMRGWLWGQADHSVSWGRNRVDGTMPLPTGTMLVFGFDRGSGDEEGTVGSGDSGGGVFLQDGTTWKLAGVIHASGGQYSRVKSGQSPFMAALHDARGFYQNAGTEWRQIDPDGWETPSTLAFATQIAAYGPAIRAISGAPPPENKTSPVTGYFMFGGASMVAGALALALARRKKLRRPGKESW